MVFVTTIPSRFDVHLSGKAVDIIINKSPDLVSFPSQLICNVQDKVIVNAFAVLHGPHLSDSFPLRQDRQCAHQSPHDSRGEVFDQTHVFFVTLGFLKGFSISLHFVYAGKHSVRIMIECLSGGPDLINTFRNFLKNMVLTCRNVLREITIRTTHLLDHLFGFLRELPCFLKGYATFRCHSIAPYLFFFPSSFLTHLYPAFNAVSTTGVMNTAVEPTANASTDKFEKYAPTP